MTPRDVGAGTPIHAGDRQLGLADPSPETQVYWDGVAAHELRVRSCDACGAKLHPRRLICPQCGAEDLTWRRATGTGHIYSVSTLHRAPSEAMRAALPYHLGIVELDEGVHLFTRIHSPDGREPKIGMRVQVGFRRLESDADLPVFELLDGA